VRFFKKKYNVIPVDSTLRCAACGNKLQGVPNKRGFYNIVCPCCGALTGSHSSIDSAIIIGLHQGTIYDLDKFDGSHLQMSLPKED